VATAKKLPEAHKLPDLRLISYLYLSIYSSLQSYLGMQQKMGVEPGVSGGRLTHPTRSLTFLPLLHALLLLLLSPLSLSGASLSLSKSDSSAAPAAAAATLPTATTTPLTSFAPCLLRIPSLPLPCFLSPQLAFSQQSWELLENTEGHKAEGGAEGGREGREGEEERWHLGALGGRRRIRLQQEEQVRWSRVKFGLG
jgi:hypothetical protein